MSCDVGLKMGGRLAGEAMIADLSGTSSEKIYRIQEVNV